MSTTTTYRDGELVSVVNHGGSENQLVGGSEYARQAAYDPEVRQALSGHVASTVRVQPVGLGDVSGTNRYGNAPKATIDYETRSACSIRDCGSWRYSLDPSTQVMCLAFRLPYWEHGRTALWHPAFPHLGIEEEGAEELMELFEWIAGGGLVEAHNAWFERGIWTNVCVPRYGWPAVPHEQWRCSAAKAASYALPRNLENLAAAMHLPIRKDVEGAKVMKKMAAPRKPLKGDVKRWLADNTSIDVPPSALRVDLVARDDGSYTAHAHWDDVARRTGPIASRGEWPAGSEEHDLPVFWHEEPWMFERLWAYCRQDVLTEEAASERLRDLSPRETDMYLMDQAVNERGFQLDRLGIETSLAVVESINRDLNAELARITGGQVTRATQRARMKDWFAGEGLFLEDTQGTTLDKHLEDGRLAPHVRRCLELLRALGRSSTAKLVAAQDWAAPATWRIHGGLLYHGASTGRWTGSGVQPHNFPRGSIKDMELAWDVLKTGDVGLMEAMYGDPMTLLSHGLRGMIVASPGRRLVVADYAAIEARVLLWLVDDDEALDVFRKGLCIYMEMATEIYGRPITDKVRQADERQMGKQAVLGLGYQMGARKFQKTLAEKWGIYIELEFAQKIVDAYRAKFWRVKKYWNDTERAAIAAVKRPGQTITCGRTKWRLIDGFLHCRLPSGRVLSYADPVVVQKKTPWGANQDCLTYMGVDALSKKWRRQESYGGLLVENITQATARDLMADAMLRCHRGGTYDVILSVHDELIAEVDEGLGSVEEFEELIAETEDWARGCPVKAEGWTGRRYKK